MTSRLQVRQRHLTDGRTITLGPCPGCDAWQLDYTEDVAAQFCTFVRNGERPPEVSTRPFHEVVEHILQEHLMECPRLRDIVAER